jgi:rhodanese-related sulfurtransferase
LHSVLQHQHKILKNKKVVLYCKSGMRSAKAIELLQNAGFNNLYNLKGGIDAFLNAN